MKIRDWMNNNSTLVTVAAAIVLIAALVYLVTGGGRDGVTVSDERWFYNVETGELEAGPRGEPAPIENDDGEQLVDVFVYGCGGCGKSKLKIEYVKKWTDEALQIRQAYVADLKSLYQDYDMENLPAVVPGMEDRQLRISPVPPSENSWVKGTSIAGREFLAMKGSCDGDVKPNYRCSP